MGKLDEIFNETQRNKSDHERFVEFEHELRFLFHGLNKDATIEDFVRIDDVKQSILTILMKDRFCNEIDKTLLSNCKYDILNELKALKEKHPNMSIDKIILFMEDYYFDTL